MNACVLIIDDSEAEQFLCEYAIRAYNDNLNVLKASDGREGLEVLKDMDYQVDTIFLDVNMPGMNGFEFLECYHQLGGVTADVVVMLTVPLSDEDSNKCMSYKKVKKIAPKPLSSVDLKECFRH